jgi:hypothetical protein
MSLSPASCHHMMAFCRRWRRARQILCTALAFLASLAVPLPAAVLPRRRRPRCLCSRSLCLDWPARPLPASTSHLL